MKRGLQEFGPLTAAGPDGIKPIMLQEGWDSIKQAFVIIAKASFLLGYTPDSWRNTLSIFLPKPGKDDYYNPKSYRTIALASLDEKGNYVAYGGRSIQILARNNMVSSEGAPLLLQCTN